MYLPLQGGGVYVNSGTVTFQSCNIHNNQATSVSAHVPNFPRPFPHRPDGVLAFADVSVLTPVCDGGVGVASWWRQYVSALISNYPSILPHCPNGKLC